MRTSRGLLPCVKVECAVAGSGWAGRAAGRRRRSHRGGCGAEGGVGGGEAGSQGADGGHGGHCCAVETGHGLRQLAGHLAKRQRDRELKNKGLLSNIH